MSKNPSKKRKRQESTRPNTNGIPTFPSLSRSTDALNENYETGSPTSRYTCNGNVHNGGSRNNLVNVVQPQISYDTNPAPLDTRRERRVVWEPYDGKEETEVKEINRQPNNLNDNMSFRNIQFQNGQQNVDVYAHAQVDFQGSSPEIHCQGRNIIPSMSSPQFYSKDDQLQILQKKCAEQQKRLADLLAKDKRRERQLQKRTRSFSVLSLQASPLRRTDDTHMQDIAHNTSNINNSARNINRDQNDRVFTFPERCYDNVPVRLSRSCDILSDDEENDPFLTPPLPPVPPPQQRDIYQAPVSSSAYERVTDNTGHDDNSDKENIEQFQETQRKFNFCGGWFNFFRGFVIILLLNVVLISLNITGVTLVVSGRLDRRDEAICINCESVDHRYVDKFQKSNEKCCLDSVSEMLELFANISQSVPENSTKTRTKRSIKELPMVQYDADGKVSKGKDIRISWTKNKENPIQRVFSKLDRMKTVITIPVEGIYFIYSNVQFFKNNNAANRTVAFGHSIVSDRGDILGSSSETCFPTSRQVMHISHLSFMHNFTSKGSVHVKLENGDDFDAKGTRLGMFRVGSETFQ